MRKTELKKLKILVDERKNKKCRDFLGPFAPEPLNIQVDAYSSFYWSGSPVYHGSILQVVDVDVDGERIQCVGREGKKVWIKNRGTVVSADAVRICYKGKSEAEYREWLAKKELKKDAEVFDHFGKKVKAGDQVVWYKTARWNGGMTNGVVKKITETVSGTKTVVMEDGAKYGQGDGNIVVMENM